MSDEPIERVLERLRNTKEHSDYWTASCPAHDDSHPSLRIKENQEGVVSIKCYAGCSNEEILNTIGLHFRDLYSNNDIDSRLTAVERKQLEQDRRIKNLEHEQQRIDRQLQALRWMAQSTDHLLYHRNLQDTQASYAAWEAWSEKGVNLDSIERYQLGYCLGCPTDKEHRPSLTIPIFNSQHQLSNIRHRIIDAPNGNKYRPHIAGLPTLLFNAGVITQAQEWALVIEGEIKSIVLDQNGLPCAATMGQNGFNPHWVKRFSHLRRVYFGYDPDALGSATRDAAMFDGRGYVVEFPLKPDDMITRHGASADDLTRYIHLAQRIGGSTTYHFN